MRIAAISYTDDDVFEGMNKLLELYPDAMVLVPVTQNEIFLSSVVMAIKEHKNPYTLYVSEVTEDIEDLINGAADVHVVDDPIEAIVKDIDNGDLLATVSDDDGNLQKIVDGIGEKGLATWNMAEGLKLPISNQDDFGADDLVDALDVFVEALVRYVTKASMETMRETILNGIAKFMDDEDFDDEEDEF